MCRHLTDFIWAFAHSLQHRTNSHINKSASTILPFYYCLFFTLTPHLYFFTSDCLWTLLLYFNMPRLYFFTSECLFYLFTWVLFLTLLRQNAFSLLLYTKVFHLQIFSAFFLCFLLFYLKLLKFHLITTRCLVFISLLFLIQSAICIHVLILPFFTQECFLFYVTF